MYKRILRQFRHAMGGLLTPNKHLTEKYLLNQLEQVKTIEPLSKKLNFITKLDPPVYRLGEKIAPPPKILKSPTEKSGFSIYGIYI